MISTIYDKACQIPSDINEHLPTLKYLGQQVNHVTEFGVRGICSTWAWLAAEVKHLCLYDIVHPKDHPHPEVPPYNWDTLVELRPDVRFYKESTLEATIDPTELLFIDTLHTGTQLRQELLRHHEKVSRYIVFHDTYTYGERGEDPSQPGLDWAIIPFVAQYPWRITYRVPNCNGLTILEPR